MMWHQWIGWGLFVVGVTPALVSCWALWREWRLDTRRQTRRWKKQKG